MAFSGFPSTAEATPIPNLFFSTVLEQLADPDQLRCALRFFYLLHRKKRLPRVLAFSELAADPVLASIFGNSAESPSHKGHPERLQEALRGCVDHGVLLSLQAAEGQQSEALIFLNTPRERQFLERLQRGEASLPQFPTFTAAEPPAPRRSIFELYEQSIGRVVTPLIGDELKDAEQEYPPEWIEEAFKEAVRQNKQSWAYIAAILRRWKQEGRLHGKAERRPQKIDPKEYLRSYGGIPRR